LRVFCMTDDKEEKTLEQQEHFIEVAKSRDVEVLETKSQYLEFAGNIVPVTKSGEQLALTFRAFRENRLPFTVRVKDSHADPIGRIAFMREAKAGRGEPPQTPICNLNIVLPTSVTPDSIRSEPDLLALQKKYGFLHDVGLVYATNKPEAIHKADLRLSDICNLLGRDWIALANCLEIPDSDINLIETEYPDNTTQEAMVMLRLWMTQSDNKVTGNTLEKALRKIGREDIVNQCIFNVELVTDDLEKAVAKVQLEHQTDASSERTTLHRNTSLDVSFDEQDLMKDSESLDEVPESIAEKDEQEDLPTDHEETATKVHEEKGICDSREAEKDTAEPEAEVVEEPVVIRTVVGGADDDLTRSRESTTLEDQLDTIRPDEDQSSTLEERVIDRYVIKTTHPDEDEKEQQRLSQHMEEDNHHDHQMDHPADVVVDEQQEVLISSSWNASGDDRLEQEFSQALAGELDDFQAELINRSLQHEPSDEPKVMSSSKTPPPSPLEVEADEPEAFATRSDAAVVEEHRIAGSEEPFRPEELEKTSSSVDMHIQEVKETSQEGRNSPGTKEAAQVQEVAGTEPKPDDSTQSAASE